MIVAERTLRRGSLLIVLLAASVAWTSCDLASAGNTAISSASFDPPPKVRHRFSYTKENITEAGHVEVVSTITSSYDLDDVLFENLGASRADVVSAQVDSVVIDRISTSTLSGAQLHLGTNADCPIIARVQFNPNEEKKGRDRTSRAVTEAVKSGSSNVFARFDIEDPNKIPNVGGKVSATVYYRLEVGGI
ncbi:hypothetical protein GGQ20_000279 [Salinibacter ruber]|uniref:hypothetical protein n=1 Tax=Salinibacter ruber TaxID=146919 RepID=UPI000E58A086|nr:hypothetical protein [Salinibacter ruber]MCS3698987.1 hypothetical protein [Salinibacter ruber]